MEPDETIETIAFLEEPPLQLKNELPVPNQKWDKDSQNNQQPKG